MAHLLRRFPMPKLVTKVTTPSSPIGYDSQGTRTTNLPTTASTSASWSHTAGTSSSGSTAIIVYILGFYGGSVPGTISSATVTYGGKTLTQIGSSLIGGSSNTGTLYAYGANGVTPGTGTVSASLTFTQTMSVVAFDSVTYLNSNGFNSAATNTGASRSNSFFLTCGPVTSAPNKMVSNCTVGYFYSGGTFNGFSGYSGTQRYGNFDSNGMLFFIGDAPGASSVSFTLTAPFSGAVNGLWSDIAIPIT